jgi:hypothetical protein
LGEFAYKNLCVAVIVISHYFSGAKIQIFLLIAKCLAKNFILSEKGYSRKQVVAKKIKKR